jgi:hypothetical protein
MWHDIRCNIQHDKCFSEVVSVMFLVCPIFLDSPFKIYTFQTSLSYLHFGMSCHMLCIFGVHCDFTFLYRYIGEGGGDEFGPLGTAATYRPLVPALGDYDNEKIDGLTIGRGSRSTRKNLPQCFLSTTNAICLPGREPRPPQWETND